MAAQVIEDLEAGLAGRPVGYHAYNAVLKRVFAKPRAAMTQAELEALVAWLEHNRVSGHLELIQDDQRYEWSTRQRRTGRRAEPAEQR